MSLPVRFTTRTIILPTEDWFEDVRQYDAGLVYFKTNVQTLLLKTIALLVSMPGKSNKTFPYMSVLDFANSLRRYFLEENTRSKVKHSSEALDICVEVSTHFYRELLDFVRYNRLMPYQVSSLRVKGWSGEDLIVTIDFI